MRSSINVHYILLNDGVVEFIYFPTDLLPAVSVHFCYRNVKISNRDSRLNSFSLKFYQVFSHIFRHSVVGYIGTKDCYVFLEYCPIIIQCHSFSLITSLALNSAQAEINIPTPALLITVSMVYHSLSLHF